MACNSSYRVKDAVPIVDVVGPPHSKRDEISVTVIFNFDLRDCAD